MTAKIQLVTKESNDCHAGSKAPRDAAAIAERMGFCRIVVKRPMPPVRWLSWPYLLLWLAKSFLYLLRIPRGALVFIQFTNLSFTGRKSIRMLGLMRKLRHVRIVTLVHDVDMLRGWVEAEDLAGIDSRLRQIVDVSDILIVHNAAMREWFVGKGVPASRLLELGLFDYLSDSVGGAHSLSNEIVIAGNLSLNKARYLSSLHAMPDVKWNLFGPEYDEASVGGTNVTYCGCYASEELPQHLKGSFGLVWDGDSLETCSGPFGEYLRYNNPHKCSLYLAAGLPVIVWRQSALAEFVRANNLGLCVESLLEVPSAISKLSVESYSRICHNVRAVSEKLRAGHFLEAAINEAAMRIEGK